MCRCRGKTAQCGSEAEPASIVAAKKESAIAAIVNVGNHHGAADGGDEFIPDEGSFRLSRQVFKEVGCVKRRVTMHFVSGSMNLVGPTLDDGIHDAAGILAGVGAAAAHDAHFLNGIKRQPRCCRGGVATFIEGGEVGGGIGVGGSVHKKGVGSGA